MQKQMKEYKAICIKLDSGIAKRLSDMAKITRMKQTNIIENALDLYLNNFEATGVIHLSEAIIPPLK